ncbi:MAG: CvpA family protein [Muribaculaceae bacterium]|nr:CvpA family protein [Muribaculaceae bacterium]
MTDFAFHIIVIAALAVGTIKGFRDKLTSQVPSALGITFGILCSYLFRLPVEEYVASTLVAETGHVEGGFIISNISCTLIFIITYAIFFFCTYVLKFFFRMIETGMLDSIAGAIFGVARAALFVSMSYNLFLSLFPDSRLLDYAMHDDGDIVHEVMLLSPFLLGSESVDELAHKVQLDKARYIS